MCCPLRRIPVIYPGDKRYGGARRKRGLVRVLVALESTLFLVMPVMTGKWTCSNCLDKPAIGTGAGQAEGPVGKETDPRISKTWR